MSFSWPSWAAFSPSPVPCAQPAILAFVDPGLAKDPDCGQRLAGELLSGGRLQAGGGLDAPLPGDELPSDDIPTCTVELM
jgi:hypothetical protein